MKQCGSNISLVSEYLISLMLSSDVISELDELLIDELNSQQAVLNEQTSKWTQNWTSGKVESTTEQ